MNSNPNDREIPVRAKAALVDPTTMEVRWLNESASQGFPAASSDPTSVPVEHVVPLSDPQAVHDALRAVATTGTPRHLSTDILSRSTGSVTMVTSIYRLPDGMLLVLTENTYQARQREPKAGPSRRSGLAR